MQNNINQLPGKNSVLKESKLTIGDLVDIVSRLTGKRCTASMIYNYERIGLMQDPERTNGGHRIFNLGDVQRVYQIKTLQSKGNSLSQIKMLLEEDKVNITIDDEIYSLPENPKVRIVEAAINIFPIKGYEKTSIQDIASAAGISIPTFYSYFESKEELFISLIDQVSFLDVLEELNETFTDNCDICLDEIREALIQLAFVFVDVHKSNSKMIRLFIAESKNFPSVGIHYRQNLILPVMNLLEEYLECFIAAGVLRQLNPRMAAHAFYGIFINFLLTIDFTEDENYLNLPAMEIVIPHQIDLFLEGVKSRE